MIPDHQTCRRLSDKGVLLSHGGSGGVVHGVSALPFSFSGTFENVRGLKIGLQEAGPVSCTGNPVRDLGRIVRCPPEFIGTSWRRIVGAGPAGNPGAQSVGIVGRIRTQPVGQIEVVVPEPVEGTRNSDLTEIVQAKRLLGLGIRAGERREQHGRQYSNDRNDHQEFDQGESSEAGHWESVGFGVHARRSTSKAIYSLKYIARNVRRPVSGPGRIGCRQPRQRRSVGLGCPAQLKVGGAAGRGSAPWRAWRDGIRTRAVGRATTPSVQSR